MKSLIDHMEQIAIEPEKQDYIFISHGDCEADANAAAEMMVSRLGIARERIVLSAIGPVIGSHSGPGTLAVFFMARDRG